MLALFNFNRELAWPSLQYSLWLLVMGYWKLHNFNVKKPSVISLSCVISRNPPTYNTIQSIVLYDIGKKNIGTQGIQGLFFLWVKASGGTCSTQRTLKSYKVNPTLLYGYNVLRKIEELFEVRNFDINLTLHLSRSGFSSRSVALFIRTTWNGSPPDS